MIARTGSIEPGGYDVVSVSRLNTSVDTSRESLLEPSRSSSFCASS
jgi:hypothetical protein